MRGGLGEGEENEAVEKKKGRVGDWVEVVEGTEEEENEVEEEARE